jgi:TRAP-type mannitol/chloroaromatic compound transport system substrate-binding protein
MERRTFLMKAGVVAAAGAATLADAPNVIAQPKIRWRMPTSWPPALDVLDGNARRFAKMVEEMSGGRLTIEVLAAGELIPAFGVFDAVQAGTLESYNSASYYWGGKEPAVEWFTTIPFGMSPGMQLGWYYHGGGLQLWEEVYAPFNLVPRPSASTGPQMGGWFKRRINSMADLRGLKIRLPGLGGKLYGRAGASVVLLPAGEIFPALERGVIDAAEWVGPHDDMKLGLHRAARFYYYPGWHEPGTTGEYVFNKKAYEALPVDLRRILDYAAATIHTLMWQEYETKNGIALEVLRTQFKDRVELVAFPKEVLDGLRKLTTEAVEEEARKSPMARKVHDSYMKYYRQVSPWAELADGAYHAQIRG